MSFHMDDNIPDDWCDDNIIVDIRQWHHTYLEISSILALPQFLSIYVLKLLTSYIY